MNDVDNRHPLLGAAASISDGDAVDWQELRRHVADDVDTAIVEELQVLDEIAQVHRNEWGALEILEPIGHGTFGTVYRAFDRDLHRHVALKVTRPLANSGAFDPERLVKEARRLARVKHPNVVAVYSAEHRGNEVGVAMEWIKGQTLDALVESRGPLGASEVALIGIDVCRAVTAVHAAGLLHGDIKAHNVMREDGGRIVLMDFGASRDLSRPPSVGHDFAGTPLYIAPEVFAGQPRSRASDIYSVGVLLYYLSSGRYPVHGDTRSAIDRQHAQSAGRQHLRDVRPDLPDAFVDIVQRAIAERPADRFESAGTMADALRGLIGDDRAAPVRSWRRPVVLLVAASALLMAGLASWLALHGGSVPEKSAASAATTSVATSTNPPVAPSYEVDVAFYRVDAKGATRLKTNDRIRPGDRLFVRLNTSVPAHVYLVNEDEQGATFMLFPLDTFPQKNPLSPGRAHQLPGTRDGEEFTWEVSTPGGRDHFVIFVSPAPVPPIEKVLAELPRASEDTPVLSRPVGANVLNTLRGVGGVRPANAPRSGLPLYEQYPTPLPDKGETASGLWVRQLTLTSE